MMVTACNRTQRNVTTPTKLVLHFELDSAGNITDEQVKAQVISLASELQKSADKMMMTAYTEQSGNAAQDEATAKAMARAVRELMKTQGEPNATNVGVVIKGFENPIDSANAANIINRRIEIVPL